MQKLLYITPHLSTGGAPQYLLKKIELLKDKYEIFLVEYTNLGGTAFVIQKNRIFDIIPPEKRITLGEDKTQLLDFLEQIQPNIVHLEEIPELFMDRGIAEILYNENRKYTIFETSHDSSQNPDNKQFFPDKFMFVSNWQIDQYKGIDVPSVLVEYPIEYKENRDRISSCKRLGLDPNKKHIIHVGLFTPRKNQAEFFEYARLFPEYEFHCIGNQASNFENYWGPLMKNKPSNLTWWGERNDVDNFYEAADLFLFTSKGNSHDKETMPLVIREALSWKLPILIYNLEVYQNYFNNHPVEYLIADKNQNIKSIKNIMGNLKTVSPLITAKDFNISLEGENKITFSYKREEQFDCKIVVKEKYSNAPMFWFKANFVNYTSWWCVPNQGFSIKNSWITELTLEFYTPSNEFLFSKDLFVKENGIKPSVKLELANNFDCLFHNYSEMFIDENYNFLFKDKLSTVLDIGANAGTFCKLFLEKGANKVYAFEPNQDALTNLNYLASQEPDLKVIEKAVHTNEKDLKFYITPNNTTIGSFNKSHLEKENITPEEIIVPTITLKNFIQQENLSKIDLIKIDIEGAEYDIIENLEDEVFNITNKFLIEWHDNTDERVQKLIDKLISKGYSITKIFKQNSKKEVFNTEDYKQSIIGTFLAEKLSPKVTVLIPTYNHENYIEQCVDSVLTQSTTFDYQILISDDCSTDKTWDIIQKYKNNPKVSLHKTVQNIGPYFQRYKELYSLINSEYITLLDGDDFYVEPNKLQTQVDFLDSNPKYVMHAINYWYANDKGEFITPEGLPTNVYFQSLKDRIHSYKECLGQNYVGFGPMWRNIFNVNIIDLYPTKKNEDFRWGEFMLYLQKGKCYNDNTSIASGAYRLLDKGSQFTSKNEDEKDKFLKPVKEWNNQYITNDIIIIDAFIHDSLCLKKLKQSVNNLKPLGLPLMLVTNSKPENSILNLFDYIIYDHNNRLFEEPYNDVETINLWHHSPNYRWEAWTKSTQKHGLSVLANLYTSTNFAKSLGFTHFYRIEYDATLEKPLNLIKEAVKTKTQNKKGFAYINENRFMGFQAWYFDLDLFTSIFPQINNEYQYKESLKSISNKDFLVAEEFVYNLFLSTKAIDQIICKPPQDQHTDFGKNSAWNQVVTPAESNLIQDGFISLPYKVKDKNEVALITWNISTENPTTNKFTVQVGDSTQEIIHNITGKGSFEFIKIPITSEDTIITTRSDKFVINTSNLHEIPHNYEDLPS